MGWEDEYQTVLRAVLTLKGRAAKERHDPYSYRDTWLYSPTDFKIDDHIRKPWDNETGCQVTVTGLVEETQWDQFTDTFHDPSENTGFLGTASCQCGRYENFPILYKADLSTTLRDLFEIMREGYDATR